MSAKNWHYQTVAGSAYVSFRQLTSTIIFREAAINILSVSILVCVLTIIACFLAGVFTQNYSHVDRLWSILPPVFAVIWLTHYYTNTRFLITAVLVIVWGSRLTFNFYRRGGYSFQPGKGFVGEDYRWAILRSKIPNRVLFELFNLLFISSYQLGLIFLFTLPLYYMAQFDTPLRGTDWVLYAAYTIFLIGETVADNQQFSFHRRKQMPEYRSDPRYLLGFNTFGLWRFSRHPNYVGELGMWLVVYLLSVSASGHTNWTAVGIILLMLLFVGSTRMTETITRSKYPRFREWQAATPVWIPFVGMLFRMKKRRIFWKSILEK